MYIYCLGIGNDTFPFSPQNLTYLSLGFEGLDVPTDMTWAICLEVCHLIQYYFTIIITDEKKSSYKYNEH